MRNGDYEQTIRWKEIESQLFTDSPTMSHIDTLALLDSRYPPKITDKITARNCQLMGIYSEIWPLTQHFVKAAQRLQERGTAWTTTSALFTGIQNQEPCGIWALRFLQAGGDEFIYSPVKQRAGLDGLHMSGRAEVNLTLSLTCYEQSDIESVKELVASLSERIPCRLVGVGLR